MNARKFVTLFLIFFSLAGLLYIFYTINSAKNIILEQTESKNIQSTYIQNSKEKNNFRNTYENEYMSITYDNALIVDTKSLGIKNSATNNYILLRRDSENICDEEYNPSIFVQTKVNDTNIPLKQYIKEIHNTKTMDNQKFVYEIFGDYNYRDDNTLKYEGYLGGENPQKYFVKKKDNIFVSISMFGGCGTGSPFSDEDEFEFYKVVDSLILK